MQTWWWVHGGNGWSPLLVSLPRGGDLNSTLSWRLCSTQRAAQTYMQVQGAGPPWVCRPCCLQGSLEKMVTETDCSQVTAARSPGHRCFSSSLPLLSILSFSDLWPSFRQEWYHHVLGKWPNSSFLRHLSPLQSHASEARLLPLLSHVSHVRLCATP